MKYNSPLENPLSFLSSYTFKLQVDKSGGDIRTRLDMVGELLGFVEAVAMGKKFSNSEDEKTVLNQLHSLQDDLKYLNLHYEPYLDFEMYTHKKNGTYRVELCRISTEVKKLIAQHNLITKDDIEGIMLGAPILGGLR